MARAEETTWSALEKRLITEVTSGEGGLPAESGGADEVRIGAALGGEAVAGSGIARGGKVKAGRASGQLEWQGNTQWLRAEGTNGSRTRGSLSATRRLWPLDGARLGTALRVRAVILLDDVLAARAQWRSE